MKKHAQLYILPFDHRGSFLEMFGMKVGDLTPENLAVIYDYKHIVFEGFLRALEMGVSKSEGAILVDEQFGAKIHQEAKDFGITRILTVEKSGQDEFDFEYGENFREHIEKLNPDYAKVLIRYNAFGPQELNKRQIEKLKSLDNFCKEKNHGFLLELLAVAIPEQLAECGGDEELYEKTMRGRVMEAGVKDLQESGIEPDVWKLEGLEDFEQMKAVVDQVRSGGREDVGVIVLGRGESEEKVRQWLRVAAKIPGVIGFAVGRTVFKQPLADFHQRVIPREEAVERIAKNYRSFVDLFEDARKV